MIEIRKAFTDFLTSELTPVFHRVRLLQERLPNTTPLRTLVMLNCAAMMGDDAFRHLLEIDAFSYLDRLEVSAPLKSGRRTEVDAQASMIKLLLGLPKNEIFDYEFQRILEKKKAKRPSIYEQQLDKKRDQWTACNRLRRAIQRLRNQYGFLSLLDVVDVIFWPLFRDAFLEYCDGLAI